MWRTTTESACQGQSQQDGWSHDPDIPLDIDVEPGTGIAITTNKGRLVVVNHTLAAMLETSTDDIVGRYVWELNAPEYAELGKSRIRQQLTEPWDLELLASSGNRIPVTVSNVRCHLRGNPVRVALVKRRSNGNDG
jgi:PAS domain S-box-containing protein